MSKGEPGNDANPGAPSPEARGPRRVLLSGGSGFIGSHLAEHLLARGDFVTVVDNLATGRRSNLPQAHERLRFLEADLADALHAFGKGETFDEIYHLAAAVGVRLVVEKPIEAIETNVGLTSALLRFAVRAAPGGLPAPTLIASSSEVYGKPSRAVFSEEDDVVYGPTSVTRWSYACSKAIDEYLALAHARHSALPVVVVRFFNTVGPRQVGDYGMVLPRFVRAALLGEDLLVHGDGEQTRCFCDVRDVAPALPRFLSQTRCHGRVFNLGSDEIISIASLAAFVVRTLDSRSKVRTIPYSAAFAGAAGDRAASHEATDGQAGERAVGFEDLRHRKPDLRRVREAIGFQPIIGLEQTIRDLAAEIACELGFSGGSPTPPATPNVPATLGSSRG
ncbi:MAG: GDP-mannose 4,6-dehydratase [Planctomycetota bacterium]|nr:GDP-mannose 4,6-dehydratase [Planctomycetota bacterium]